MQNYHLVWLYLPRFLFWQSINFWSNAESCPSVRPNFLIFFLMTSESCEEIFICASKPIFVDVEFAVFLKYQDYYLYLQNYENPSISSTF